MNQRYDFFVWIALLIVAVLATPFISAQLEVKARMNEVWGKENYEKLIEAQVKQINAQLWNKTEEKVEETAKNEEVEVVEENTPEEPVLVSKIEEDTKSELFQDRPVLGDENAKITWVEFSDFDCGFCKRQHSQKVYQTVKSEFEDTELNFMYRPHPIFDRDGARATDCLAFGEDRGIYYDVIAKIYASDLDNSSNASIDTIASYVNGLGGNETALRDCYDNGGNTDKLDGNLEFAATKFDIKWTPGNLLINNETWEFEVIRGAYPASEFKSAIERLLSAE